MASSETAKSNDALEAYQLRYKFVDHAFPWAALQRLHWKFHTPRYHAPTGQIFPDAKAVLRYLDLNAVPEVYSNLQSFPDEEQLETEEERREQQRMRKLVLEQVYFRTSVQEESSSGDAEPEKEEEISVATSSTVRRRSTRSRAANDQSATVQEKGSDLYLRKSSNTKRKKRNSRVKMDSGDLPAVLPSIQECLQLVAQHSMEQVQEVEAAYEQDHFADWRFLLSTNHAILLFGAGSKHHLLDTFSRKELDKEGYSLVINCCDEGVTLEALLDLIVQVFLDDKEPVASKLSPLVLDEDNDVPDVSGTGIISDQFNLSTRADPLLERVKVISRALAIQAQETLIPIFVVLKSIEGILQRQDAILVEQTLAALTLNSLVPNGTCALRLVASVDHLDAATTLSVPWIIWKEVHTYRPFSDEWPLLGDTTLPESQPARAAARKRSLGEATAARVLEVLKNIAPRHAEVVQELARLQLDKDDNDGWVDFSSFVKACKDKFLISKSAGLQPYLHELRDHQLVESKTQRGSEYWRIPYNTAKLKEILAFRVQQGKN